MVLSLVPGVTMKIYSALVIAGLCGVCLGECLLLQSPHAPLKRGRRRRRRSNQPHFSESAVHTELSVAPSTLNPSTHLYF